MQGKQSLSFFFFSPPFYFICRFHCHFPSSFLLQSPFLSIAFTNNTTASLRRLYHLHQPQSLLVHPNKYLITGHHIENKRGGVGKKKKIKKGHPFSLTTLSTFLGRIHLILMRNLYRESKPKEERSDTGFPRRI